MILPSAVTYGRIWVPKLKPVYENVLPYWYEMRRVERHVSVAYQKAFMEMFFFNKPIPEGLMPYEDVVCLTRTINCKPECTPLITGPDASL